MFCTNVHSTGCRQEKQSKIIQDLTCGKSFTSENYVVSHWAPQDRVLTNHSFYTQSVDIIGQH